MRPLAKELAAISSAAFLILLAGALPLLAQGPAEGPPPAVERDVVIIRRGGPPAPPPEGATGIYWFGGEAGVPAGDPAVGPMGPPPEAHMGPLVDPPIGTTISFASPIGSFGGGTVTGAPYSAEAVTQMEQRLADGNRIVRSTTATVYRDGEGRTRRDQTLGANGPGVVGGDLPEISMIYDPVAGVRITLNHQRQIAHKMPAQATPVGRPFSQGVLVEGHDVVSAPRGRALIHAAPVNSESSSAEAPDIFTIPLPPPPGVNFTEHVPDAISAPDRRSESLGTQLIEGIEAQGTRSISTIPAGAIGNDFAIEIVSERWYSPELQAVVLSLHKDPRMGETTYRLSNIQRTEPSHSLFEVPEGYRVIERGTPASPPLPAP